MNKDKELQELTKMWSQAEKMIATISTELLILGIKKMQAELDRRKEKLKA